MDPISAILSHRRKPALLIGNGINRFHGSQASSWAHLLAVLAKPYDLEPPEEDIDDMSFTEFFDILDLARSDKDARMLQRLVCDELRKWVPSDHHGIIVNWAKRHDVPIVTVNFDETLSKSIDASFHRGSGRKGFSHWYPWKSYFSDREIDLPRHNFAIWHAHGIMRYPRSIRLGLTHYMGSVQRARALVYRGQDSLRARAFRGNASWRGQNTWLDILFFCPLLIFGFACKRDENLLRWLFLERARLHKTQPEFKAKAWFLDTSSNGGLDSKPFFEGVDIEYVCVPDPKDIYKNPMWHS